ncbi:MAG: transposase, partial [Deltaproteobacteria bacterium]|nr:transposase [Deltaproteobacteria bacterium]
NHELGIKDVGFVLDKGFCSTANIKFLEKNRYDFIMAVLNNCKTVRAVIDLARASIISVGNLVADGVYAVSKKGIYYGTESVLNVYYSPELAEHKRKDLIRELEIQEENLGQLTDASEREIKKYRNHFFIQINEDRSLTFERNFDQIDKTMQNFGFFCLLTNTNLNASEVLDKYRRKDVIEKVFDDVKNHIDMKKLRIHNTKTTDGKLFCSFIALITVSEIGIKLKDLMKKKDMNQNSVIREMEKIRVVIGNDGKRIMNPLTKLQQKILEPFGLGEEDVKAYLARLT